MAKFCQNCGSPLGEGVRFCPSCGSSVPQAAQPQQPKSSPDPQPQRQADPQPHSYTPRPQVQIPEQFAQRNAARAQRNAAKAQRQAPAYQQPARQQAPAYQQPAAPAAKKKGKGGIAAVSLMLVAAIVVGIFGFRNGGWFRGGNEPKPEFGKVQASEKGSVSVESPAITLCGVTVDVDTLMLESSGRRDVTVSVYESGTEADGTRYEAYELEMGKHEDFYVPVAVTFPCRVQSGTDVIVEHYKDGNWMPLFTFVNEEAGTATAYFGSFSPARVTYRPIGSNPSLYKVVADEDNPYLLTLAVVSNYWNILQRTNPAEFSDEVTAFIDDPENYAVKMPTLDPDMNAKAAYQAFTETNTMWTFCDAMINLGIDSLPPASQSRAVSFMIDHSGELGNAMNAIPFLAMAAQVGMDLNSTDKDRTQTAGYNLYKNMLGSGGTIYSLTTGYSHVGFTIAFVGVALMGMEIDYFVDAAKSEQAENVSAVFNAYYTKVEPFDSDHWYRVFEEAYWHSNGDADSAMREIKKAVDDYCEKFWREVYDETNADILFAASSAGYKNVFFNATSDQKAALTEQQKAKVWHLIETEAMPKIQRFLIERLQEKTFAELTKATETYNKTLSFTIQESVDQQSTENTKYQGCTVSFGSEGKPIPDLYWNVPEGSDYDDGWDVDYECTVLGFLKMGMPNQVLVYKNESDYKSGAAPIAVKDFTAKTDGDRQTTVELGNTSTGADWINGAWSYASYDGEGGAFSGFHSQATRITVIDADTLLYESYYYGDPAHPDWKSGVDYAFERQYTVDPKTGAILIEKTETGIIYGNLYGKVGDEPYLDPTKIERLPEKDKLTGYPAVRFTYNPGTSEEYVGNLRFNREAGN